jgi:hypothetical protein
MKLTEITRADECKNGSCPAVYVADDTTVLVVQGKMLDSATTAELVGVADDELAVAIPRETLLRAVAQLEGRA